MKQARAERTRFVAVGTLCAMLAAGMALWMSVRADRLEQTAARVSTVMIELERSIGYAGFIHAFKNYVLRPGEEQYWTEAVGHYEDAVAAFDELEEVIEENGLDIGLSGLRGTLALYREMLDRAREAREAGASIEEIDDLVRISDEEAALDIAEFEAAFQALLADRLRTARTWRLLNLLATAAVFAVILAVALQYRRKDIEIERRAMAEVTRARDQLSAVFSAVRSGIVGLDRDRRVVALNPPARHLLGGLSDQTPFDWPARIRFLDSEGLAPLDASADPINRALAGGDIRGEVQSMSRGGTREEVRYVRVTSARIGDPASEIAAVVVLDDITEQERSRQQNERRERLDALGQLTGGIAHDFNNVLATILYANEMAAEAIADEAPKRLLERAIASVERGRKLTARLLSFASRQPGRATAKPVAAIFDELGELVLPLMDARIDVRFDPGPPGLSVFCDTGQLENALLNLVLNGRDAILGPKAGGRIRITARLSERNGSGPEVEIAVSDDGPGMTPAVRERATDPFFTTKSASGGSGLGLAMVYGFVRQAGGDMKIYSEEGHGTTVSLFMPRARQADGTQTRAPSVELRRGNGETVLVVEDEPDLLDMTAAVLEDLGYQAVRQPSGSAALAWIEAGGAFDVLLSDVVMPGGIGGFELVRRVQDASPGKPVLLMSGHAGFTADDMGGGDTVLLQKPCGPGELSRALRTALENTAA